MTFVTAFLWGLGLTTGMAVGLVVWIFLRTGTNKLLGITEHWISSLELQTKSLEALEERNRLTVATHGYLDMIGEAIRDDLRAD